MLTLHVMHMEVCLRSIVMRLHNKGIGALKMTAQSCAMPAELP